MVSEGSASTWSRVEQLLGVKEKTNLKFVCLLVNPYGDLHRGREEGDLDAAIPPPVAFYPSQCILYVKAQTHWITQTP